MTNIKRLFLLFALLVSTPVFAADRYVRPNGGAYGTEDGSDWTNAYDGFSDISWAAISGGDTIWVAGGTYTQSLTFPKGGTDNTNRIVVKRSTSAAHGTETGWSAGFDAQVFLYNVRISTAGYNNITIDGQQDNGIYINHTNAGSIGIYLGNAGNVDGSDNVTLRYIKLVGRGAGVVGEDCNHMGIKSPSASLHADGLLLEYCDFSGYPGAVARLDTTNAIIQYNKMYEARNGASNCHNDIIISYRGSGIIRYNTFHGSDAAGLAYDDNSGPWYIHNNLFYDIGYPIDAQRNVEFYIYNNTFAGGINVDTNGLGTNGHSHNTNNSSTVLTGDLNSYTSLPTSYIFADGGTNNAHAVIMNTTTGAECIVTSRVGGADPDAWSITCSGGLQGGTRQTWQTNDTFRFELRTYGAFKNNIVWGMTSPSPVIVYSGVTYDYNWYQGSTNYGSGANNVLGGSSDPFSDSGNDVYTLGTGSTAINTGADLGASYADDLLGNTRSGTWDIGAYESGAGAGWDTTPNSFAFTDQTDVARSTVIYSDSITVLGIDNVTSITSSGTGCSYQVNGAGSWLTTGGDNVSLNDTVQMKTTSSGSYATDTPCTLTLNGNVADVWHVTTLAAPGESGLVPTFPPGLQITGGVTVQ